MLAKSRSFGIGFLFFKGGLIGIQIVSFNCVLKNKAGNLISSTFNREVIIAAEKQDGLLSGLVNGLQNLKEGEKRSISLEASQAYGFYDQKKVILYPRKKLPKEITIKTGNMVSIVTKSGLIRSYRIVEAYGGDMVMLDGNHPLAGQDLIFEIETLTVRDATSADMVDSAREITNQYLH